MPIEGFVEENELERIWEWSSKTKISRCKTVESDEELLEL